MIKMRLSWWGRLTGRRMWILRRLNPLKGYKNIMYTLHFYADTHRKRDREKAKRRFEAGVPLFVSEFGICDASERCG